MRGFRSDGVLIKWVPWRSGFDRCGFRSDGVLITWVLWRSDFDRVGAKIMGLLVYDLMLFFQWACGVVVVIGGCWGSVAMATPIT